MAKVHNLGFPRIGENRELKFAVERYWSGAINAAALLDTVRTLRQRHWRQQQAHGVELVPVGDFSLYDQVLDMSFLFGNIPARFQQEKLSELDQYFRVARGRSREGAPLQASEMTKWFDTNYHYIVPEFGDESSFALNADKLFNEIEEAQALGVNPKPVLIGPVSYLWLGKSTSNRRSKLDLLPALLERYHALLQALSERGIEWVQLDEPILALDLSAEWQSAFEKAYTELSTTSIKKLLAVYFGPLQTNLSLAIKLPVQGLHIDAVRGRDEAQTIVQQLPAHSVLSLGVVDGRNIWKSHLAALLDWLEPLNALLGDRLWLAPSCSLLHVPVDLKSETAIDGELRDWLAFAVQKLDELRILAAALNGGRAAVGAALQANAVALNARKNSKRITNSAVQQRTKAISVGQLSRKSAFAVRSRQQREALSLPLFPTTTIGSFPQTRAIRKTRSDFRNRVITQAAYIRALRTEIESVIREQEAIGLDVLVHGEPERNDMVEYFGEQLAGFAFTRNGWVQSYGSRCVKPPIIYGDVFRRHAMTVDWITYAQSLTEKPVKGMLTGPVTIQQWSFVRDDQERSQTAKQIALALRDEVADLEAAGVSIIQVDEPAFREGLPLRTEEQTAYFIWAIEAFRLATAGVDDATQIHTHMCYSEFNDCIDSIAALDADVITIETSRSDKELLEAFESFSYPNEIGPGVYDIHSPNIPSVDQITTLIEKAALRLPKEQLWLNPDCGLKTRQWEEVRPALANMVQAGKILRERYACSAKPA